MFQFVTTVDYVAPDYRTQTAMYNFLETLRCADAKLTLCIDAWDDDRSHDYFDSRTLYEIRATVRLHIMVFQELVFNVTPSIPDRVWKAIVALKNDALPSVSDDEANQEHSEGVAIALALASKCIKEALDLSARYDGDEIDPTYELMMAADYAVEMHASCVEGSISSHFLKQKMAHILRGEPIPPYKELRREWVRENFPNGVFHDGTPTWDHEADEPVYLQRSAALA